MGNVYVAERHNQRVQKFTSDGTFILKWGKEGYWNNGEFSWPNNIAIDENDNVYISDIGTSIIQKFTPEGVFIKKWGGYGYENGKFTYPGSIVSDKNGNVYVLDGRIQKFTSDGLFITKWGSGFDDGDIARPRGIAVDSKENVYVVDSYERVQKFTKDGEFILKWGNSSDGGGIFGDPCGVAIDKNDNVYVIDTWNYRIQKFDTQGNFIKMWGSRGKGNGEFNYPIGIAVDKNGYVYVADAWNHCVQKFSSDGDFIIKWGSEGTENGEFKNLSDIAVDNKGNVYTAGNGVQVFTTNGDFILKWGNPYHWSGIAADEDGNVYLTYQNDRVQKYTTDGQLIAEFGEEGFDAGQFNNPSYLCVSPSGRIYIADTLNNRVQVFLENERASFDKDDDPNKPEPGDWVKISGKVTNQDGIPLCAMVLANGQHIFSCDGSGNYGLEVPVDENGQITLFAFCDGLAPFKYIFKPEKYSIEYNINMYPADSPLYMQLNPVITSSAKSGWVKIAGKVVNKDGVPLCAMVLANGQHMFSCEGEGKYELEVPLDENGQVTLFGFCDGVQPYKEIK